MALKDRIRELRKERGISQERLARRADVSLNLIGKLEGGQITDPHYSTLRGLARALEVPLEELLREPAVPLDDAPQATGHTDAGALIDELGPYEPPTFDSPYPPWFELVDRYAARWEAKAAAREFDRGEIKELLAVVKVLNPLLLSVALLGHRKAPRDHSVDNAIRRLNAMLEPVEDAAAEVLGENDLARLLRQREERGEM